MFRILLIFALYILKLYNLMHHGYNFLVNHSFKKHELYLSLLVFILNSILYGIVIFASVLIYIFHPFILSSDK